MKTEGNDEDGAIAACIGKRIDKVRADRTAVYLDMEHGTLRLADEEQQCCEERYVTCDDTGPAGGARLLRVEVAGGACGPSDCYEEHDIQFLRVITDKGVFVAETHNIHNGYYGGFEMCATFEPKKAGER